MNAPKSDHTPPDPHGRQGPVSRDELDLLFDREMPAADRRRLTERLRRDPDRLDEVIDTRRAINRLRAPLPTPDLTDAVLDRVAHQRGFLSARLRRRVRTGRWAVAATFLLSLGVVALAHRAMPGRLDLSPAPTPVSDLGDAIRQDSLDSRQRIRDTFAELGKADLVALGSERGSVATSVGPARLTAFHVDDEQETLTRSGTSAGPAGFPGLSIAMDDNALLALPVGPTDTGSVARLAVRFSLAPLATASSDLTGAAGVSLGTGPDQSLALMGPTPSFQPGFQPVFVDMPAPGTVPLEAAVGPASAFVGRYDPFRDRSFENRLRAIRAKAETGGHPARPLPVSDRD